MSGKYERKTGTITASDPQAKHKGWNIESVIANEMSHHLGAMTQPSVPTPPIV